MIYQLFSSTFGFDDAIERLSDP